MSNLDLAEAREVERCMTPGEWRPKATDPTRIESGNEDGTVVASTYTSSFAPPRVEAAKNAKGIAYMRNHWLALLDRLEEAERERDEITALLEKLRREGRIITFHGL